jgi:hypothetical protein
MSAPGLTRWNRAGLSRLRYVDGNAAVYYDLLRAALRERFATWPKDPPPAEESDERRRERREEQYVAARGDWGEELARTLARACHILSEYLDAYANESTLRTATQWDQLRRMVEMLDYHPAPPASASTPLIVMAKAGKRGRLAKGFAVKYAPTDGGKPVVFETLADLDVDYRLNALRLTGYDRSPEPVAGSTLLLAQRVTGLKLGEPLVLENGDTQQFVARLISGVGEQDGLSLVTLSAPLAAAGFVRGSASVHLKPLDKLTLLGPAQASAQNGDKSLLLKTEPQALVIGQVVFISDGAKRYFRRVASVQGRELLFDAPLDGDLRLDQAYVSRARPVKVAKYEAGKEFSAVGDLTAAAPMAVEDAGGIKNFFFTSAVYHPPLQGDAQSGLTVFTPVPSLSSPTLLHVAPPGREWDTDSFLFDTAAPTSLPRTLETTLPKSVAPGDFVVVASGDQLAWASIATLAPFSEAGRAQLTVAQWSPLSGGRFYLTQTRVYTRFSDPRRLDGWDYNGTPLGGALLPVADAERPELLVIGRRLWIEQQRGDVVTRGREAAVVDVDGERGLVMIDPGLPQLGDGGQFTLGNTVIRGNVVTAGHGESQNDRILGSGDASALNQAFVLAVSGVSFVADATMPAGVRADIDVVVDGQIWQQAASLKDSAPGDPHYAVRMTEEGFLSLEFGDGEHGRRVPTGQNNVRVRFRLGAGLAGNLAAGRLEKPARPHPLVDKLRQPLASIGGNDLESAGSLKRQAPKSLLTLERAVSADDYANLAAANAAVWRARAFPLPSALRRPRIEVVIVPAGGVALDERFASMLESFLAAHSLPGVDVTMSEFVRIWLHLEIRLRIVSAEYDPEAVKAQAAARLTEVLSLRSRDIGATLYVSDVYAVVETIPGVRNSSCELAYDRGDGVAIASGQRVEAGPREVVFLDTAARPGSLRIEFEEFEL